MEYGVVSMSWLGRCWGRMEKMDGGGRHVSRCQQEGRRLLKPVEAESDGWDGWMDGVCHGTALT